ncbi:MAG: UDP-N-acetylmuramoyl-L-alanine--D-glutamate ligase [bacterium]|nr:UDP-N-acetylmuramoyl-L-alanine--D-glutamate ligase [bacterium]
MQIAEFKGKRVLIVGLAKTGVALAKLLAEQGARVTINDLRPESDFSAALAELSGYPLRAEFGAHRIETFLDQDLILVSPGVPISQPAFEEAKKRNIPISNDLELAFSLTRAPILAISGTNGKTTTTTLLGDIFTRSGKKFILGGNIGTPLSPLVCEHPEAEFIIAEVSSFQLEVIRRFCPRVGVMLNITPDHLDRYTSLDAYIEAKARLFANQTAEDFALVNAKDPATPTLLQKRQGAGRLLFFRTDDAAPTEEEGIRLQGTEAVVCLDGRSEPICSLARMKLSGEHNRQNVLAAALAAWLCGVEQTAIQSSIDEFCGLSHRIEFVAEIKGVRFIDDSKGTNVDAVVRAIETVCGPIWLILGGRDKENDYHPLIPLVRERVRGILAIGESKDKVAKFFQGIVPVYRFDSFRDAVQQGFSLALPGDTVLLSPACASFDMFESYAHRGQVFKQLVQEIKDAQQR